MYPALRLRNTSFLSCTMNFGTRLKASFLRFVQILLGGLSQVRSAVSKILSPQKMIIVEPVVTS
jgi:hypothetical protein